MFLHFFTALFLLTAMPAFADEVNHRFAPVAELATTGSLVVPMGPDGKLPDALSEAVRSAAAGAAAAAAFEGERGKSLVLYATAGYDRLILLGTGDEPLSAPDLADLGGAVASAALGSDAASVAVLWPESGGAAHLAYGVQLGNYAFHGYKEQEEDEGDTDTVITWYTATPDEATRDWEEELAPVASAVYFARNQITEPANKLYPEEFVERTRAAFEGIDNVRIRALGPREMEKLGMGALLGVSLGSDREPRLLVVEYRGGDKNEAPLAFVGKGITFDTGGLSLKRGSGMWQMKYDMSGAAVVTAAVLALAAREAPVNAVAIAALTENMPSGGAQRPGDVRTTMSGKTIEVLNTDAEGRLVLADAVWYAQVEYSPQLLVDVATLTGTVRRALGSSYAGLFTRQDELAGKMIAAGERANEPLWRLPLHEDFREAIKSDIADIKNVVDGGAGGASVGAEVIGTFVQEDVNWAHLDIAGMAWQTKATETVPKGAVGFGIRLLNQLVKDYYED